MKMVDYDVTSVVTDLLVKHITPAIINNIVWIIVAPSVRKNIKVAVTMKITPDFLGLFFIMIKAISPEKKPTASTITANQAYHASNFGDIISGNCKLIIANNGTTKMITRNCSASAILPNTISAVRFNQHPP